MSANTINTYKQRIPANLRNTINHLNPAIADRVFYYLARENKDPKQLTQESVAAWVHKAQEQYQKAMSIEMDIDAVTASMFEFENGDFQACGDPASDI